MRHSPRLASSHYGLRDPCTRCVPEKVQPSPVEHDPRLPQPGLEQKRGDEEVELVAVAGERPETARVKPGRINDSQVREVRAACEDLPEVPATSEPAEEAARVVTLVPPARDLPWKHVRERAA